MELKNLQKLSYILDKPLSFIDLETTGMVHENSFALIEIGLIEITPNSVNIKGSLIDPEMKIPGYITEITKISNEMVRGKPKFEYFAKYINRIAENNVLCGFNSKTFDSKGLEKMLRKNNYNSIFYNQIDVRHVFLRCRKNFSGIQGQSGSLVQACDFHGIKVEGQAHRATYDISITALLAEKLLEKYGFGIVHKEVEKFKDVNAKKSYYEHLIQNKISSIF